MHKFLLAMIESMLRDPWGVSHRTYELLFELKEELGDPTKATWDDVELAKQIDLLRLHVDAVDDRFFLPMDEDDDSVHGAVTLAVEDHNHFGEIYCPDTCPACASLVIR